MDTSRPIAWVILLWVLALATFLGYHGIEALWGLRSSLIYFYVMRAILGLYTICLLWVERDRLFLFPAVYVAVEWTLNAACGFNWYVYAGGGYATSICAKDHGWVWTVIAICLIVLGAVHLMQTPINRSTVR